MAINCMARLTEILTRLQMHFNLEFIKRNSFAPSCGGVAQEGFCNLRD